MIYKRSKSCRVARTGQILRAALSLALFVFVLAAPASKMQDDGEFLRRHVKLGFQFNINPAVQSKIGNSARPFHEGEAERSPNRRWIGRKGSGFLVTIGHGSKGFVRNRHHEIDGEDFKLSDAPAQTTLHDVYVPFHPVESGLELDRPTVDTSSSYYHNIDLLSAIQCIRDGQIGQGAKYLKLALYDRWEGAQARELLDELKLLQQDSRVTGYLELLTMPDYSAKQDVVWIDKERQEVLAPCGFALAVGPHDVVIADSQQRQIHFRVDVRKNSRTSIAYSLARREFAISDGGNRWCRYIDSWLAAQPNSDVTLYEIGHVLGDVHCCVASPGNASLQWIVIQNGAQVGPVYTNPTCHRIQVGQDSTIGLKVRCLRGAGRFELSVGIGMCRVHP